ncbi:MAG: glycoside hydrolase family 78 protein [Ruminococcus flavefaciens]|nr:glycoside hydrolase family 78 protein [Ruminococcus flavefaciens]
MFYKDTKWITSGKTNDKTCSLPPEIYRKKFTVANLPEKATLTVTALGIYEISVNGKKAGDYFFAPGYTNYKKHMQVQEYDVSGLISAGVNVIEITVANGWYLGRIGNKYNVYGSCRAVIAELDLDGNVIGTDETWQVTFDGRVRFSDFYDGETIDNTEREKSYRSVSVFNGFTPKLMPHFGAFVRAHERFVPVKYWKSAKGTIYDFGQNFSGVVRLKAKAEKGTTIKVKHAEIVMNGEIFTKNYRSAKVELNLICKEGENEFFPEFTFTGFRYVEITSDKPIEVIEIEGVALYSEIEKRGNFSCSDERLNKLQSCLVWSMKSNYVDIPTDCPQRDERLGWTGEACVFARTACYNYDVRKFLNKWLFDLYSHQVDGAVPSAAPSTGMYDPSPKKPVPLMLWGDAAVVVPWSMYLAYGDKEQLTEHYKHMKEYALSEQRAAEKYGKGIKKYLWNKNKYQFGDWCANDTNWYGWNKRGKHLATLWYYNTVNICRKASRELGFAEDEKYFSDLAANIQNAFIKTYLQSDGKFKKAHIASMYVDALYFGIIQKEHKAKVAKRLAELVIEQNYKVMTGFPGTPYLLFALADNGYADLAYKVLMNESCPSWLHMIKHGATTMWERWDAIEEDGSFFHGGAGMVSFNHYCYGTVGDFFYRRILGIEEIEAGYKSFNIKPITGGGLTFAEGSLETKYGLIVSKWKIENRKFVLEVKIPNNTTCNVTLPNGHIKTVGGGSYTFDCAV